MHDRQQHLNQESAPSGGVGCAALSSAEGKLMQCRSDGFRHTHFRAGHQHFCSSRNPSGEFYTMKVRSRWSAPHRQKQGSSQCVGNMRASCCWAVGANIPACNMMLHMHLICLSSNSSSNRRTSSICMVSGVPDHPAPFLTCMQPPYGPLCWPPRAPFILVKGDSTSN